MTPRGFQHLLEASLNLDYAYSECNEIRDFRDTYFQFLLEQTEGLIVVHDEDPWIGKTDQIIHHIKNCTKENLMEYLWDKISNNDDYAELTKDQLELTQEIEMETLYESNGSYASSNQQIQELLYK